MDLLAIFSSLRRHLRIVLILALLVIGANAYVVFGIPPQFQSSAQFVLIGPPAAPTDAQIVANPALGKLNNDNPFLRLPSSVVVAVLVQRVSGDQVRGELIAAGADPGYQVAPTGALGNGLVIQITGTGSSAAEARHTLELVSARTTAELRTMQTVNGADARFLYQALPINPPTAAIRKITGTVRSLIAVTVAGIVLLFGFISVAEALPTRGRRAVRGVRYGERPRATEPPPWPAEPADSDQSHADQSHAGPYQGGQAPVDQVRAGQPSAGRARPEGDLTMVLPRMGGDRRGAPEWPTDQRSSRERAAEHRSPTDRGSADRRPADRVPADRGSADRAPAERGSADRAPAERGSAERDGVGRDQAGRDQSGRDQSGRDQAERDQPERGPGESAGSSALSS